MPVSSIYQKVNNTVIMPDGITISLAADMFGRRAIMTARTTTRPFHAACCTKKRSSTGNIIAGAIRRSRHKVRCSNGKTGTSACIPEEIRVWVYCDSVRLGAAWNAPLVPASRDASPKPL